jgi:alpha-D-xyloside xylohydrolase
MKFTNGYWLRRDGVDIHGMTDVREVTVTPEAITLIVSPMQIHNKGQTLGGPLLTLTFSSPAPDILRVSAYHYKGRRPRGPAFELHDEHAPVTFSEENGVMEIMAGRLYARIRKLPFSIEYYYGDKFLTASQTRDFAYISAPEGRFFREQLGLSVGEYIYGLGERFTPYVKNGQSIDIWNEDGGTATEIAYKNIPFYVSNRGYGVLTAHPGRVQYEVASEVVSKTQFSVPGESLTYYMVGGQNLPAVVSNYTLLTGRPALPPAWSFGLWLSTSFTTDYNEETVTSFIDGMLDRGIPLSVFHFDCFWMKEYEWCNFKWDQAQFPDPAGLLVRLKARGLKICVWINPYIGQKSPLFDEGMEHGYLLKTPEGDVWQWDNWQPGLALVDFTNPFATAWYQEKLRALVKMGVDCFKTDFGERIPTDVAYYNNAEPSDMHNYYTQLYNKAVFDLLVEEKGPGGAALFARSATVGGQQFPVHWSGDCFSIYTAMSECLRGGLSLSLCGFAFWSHDIGGFEATSTADVYKRWVGFGLLSTHSRLHGSHSYRVPWLYDDEACDVLRHFVKLKNSLMPYLFAQACQAHETGVPVMRPMVLAYESDPACAFLDRQYMLGDSLLTAPVLNDKGETEIYLPQGRFTHFLSHEQADGGGYIKQAYDYFSLPLWAAENSIIPTGPGDATVYDYTDGIVLHIYELTKQTITLYDADGVKRRTVTAERNGDAITLTLDGGAIKDIRVFFHGISQITGDCESTRHPHGTEFTMDGESGTWQFTDIYA